MQRSFDLPPPIHLTPVKQYLHLTRTVNRAFSACKAAIIAFKSAGSSGRIAASLNMPLTTMNQQETP